MNINTLSTATKLDLASGVSILACIAIVAAAIEISAPILAGIGAFGAAATGVARMVTYDPSKRND